MALRPDRTLLDTSVEYFMNAVAEKGIFVVHNLAAGVASGAAMDQAAREVSAPTAQPLSAASGTVVGCLLSDVVNKDLTTTHLNQHKDEVQVGGKVALCRRGTVVTNAINGDATPGDAAYVTTSGYLANSFANSNDSRPAKVGVFRTRRDADGFATVDIHLM